MKEKRRKLNAILRQSHTWFSSRETMCYKPPTQMLYDKSYINATPHVSHQNVAQYD